MLAKRLHIKVVAEGIETIEQEKAMKNKGIEYLQGYLFHHLYLEMFLFINGFCQPKKGAIRCVIHREGANKFLI